MYLNMIVKYLGGKYDEKDEEHIRYTYSINRYTRNRIRILV